MLIGYSMPPVAGISLTSTAAWLTADNGAACIDGKPARRGRFQWRTDAVPSTAHYVALRLDLTTPQPLRVLAVLGLRNVPVGANVSAYGQRAADAGVTYDFGGANTGTVRQFADGTLGAFLSLPAAAEAVKQIELRLHNQIGTDPGTWATAATQVDVGELAVMPAVEVEIQPDWAVERIDPTEAVLTAAAAPAGVRRQAYRVLTANLTADAKAKARAGALANGMDWDRLAVAVLGDRRVIAVPRWESAPGVVDAVELNSTAIYGLARFGAAAHVAGDWYGTSITVQEVPATA